MPVAESKVSVAFLAASRAAWGPDQKTRSESSTMPLNFAAESFLGLITLAPDGLEPQNRP
jgi:hypothetical protein